jgi:hypothetical protein
MLKIVSLPLFTAYNNVSGLKLSILLGVFGVSFGLSDPFSTAETYEPASNLFVKIIEIHDLGEPDTKFMD